VSNASHYGLQPALLLFALALWATLPSPEVALVVGIFASQVILGILESRRPARPEWKIDARLRGVHIVAFIALGAAGVGVGDLYRAYLAAPLSELRVAWNMDIWPHAWPSLVQLLMVFVMSEFIWYWVHRAEHRWLLVWRVSGHGAHHAFKKLGALNGGLNHPFELFLLLLPAAAIGLFFGVGGAAAGAALLLGTQASVVHANVHLNNVGIGWLLTTNRHHIHHHSVVLEESNTNYGCAIILWDRLFGTYSNGVTTETGTGPTEPSLWQKFQMPFVEPDDTATAPGA